MTQPHKASLLKWINLVLLVCFVQGGQGSEGGGAAGTTTAVKYLRQTEVVYSGFDAWSVQCKI